MSDSCERRLNTFVMSLGFLLMTASCLKDEVPRERALPHPLKTLRVHSRDEVFITASAGTSIGELVDLSIFGSLRPGVTAQGAGALLGKPQRVYRKHGGRDTFYVFPQKAGVIEVLRQEVYSEDVHGVGWFLLWRPLNQTPQSSLSSPLLRILPELPSTGTINVNGVDGAVQIVLRQGSIDSILWLRQGRQRIPP